MRRRVIGTSIKDFLRFTGFFRVRATPRYIRTAAVSRWQRRRGCGPPARKYVPTTMMMSMINRIVVMVRPRGFEASRVVGLVCRHDIERSGGVWHGSQHFCATSLCWRHRGAGRRDHSPGAVKCTFAQFEAKQAVALERARQRQFAGLEA